MLVNRNTRESRRVLQDFSAAYKNTKVLSEMSRRSRTIQVSQLKGSELGVLIFSVFPHLVKNIMTKDEEYW